MRAVVYEDVGRVVVVDMPDPVPQDPGDAVIRVTTTAICGSDLHFLHGKAPMDPGAGIGHEAVGIVESVGPGVERFRPGDRVVVSFVVACGACWFCRTGQTQLCEEFRNFGAGIFGGDLGGAQAELLLVPHADVNLLSVPPEIDDERAIFVGDVLTTAYYGASIAGIPAGASVAVVGAGPVGYLCAQAAMAFGAGEVMVLDLEPKRLALVERMGAYPIDVTRRHPQMAVADRTEGRGADVAIEAVGSVAALESALDVVRRGGTVSVVGVYTSEVVEAQIGIWWARALDVHFSGICPVHAWWERVLGELAAGRLDPAPLVSHRLALEEAPLGYGLFDRREAMKVLLRP